MKPYPAVVIKVFPTSARPARLPDGHYGLVEGQPWSVRRRIHPYRLLLLCLGPL
jgi:hypothetical protein